jgi:CheY-like chemotaxis protein
MSDAFKLSIFGGNNRDKKKRASGTPQNQDVRETLPTVEPAASEATVMAAEPMPSNPLATSDPLVVSASTVVTPSAAELDAFFPSEQSAPEKAAQKIPQPERVCSVQESPMASSSKNVPKDSPTSANASEAAAQARTEERRRKRRARISTPVRVRSMHVTENGPDEITTTVNISRIGLLIETASTGFFRSMPVAVVLPYTKTPGVPQAEQEGFVVRVSELPDGRRSVAVALGTSVGDLINTAGHKLDWQTEEQPALMPAKAEESAGNEEPKINFQRDAGSSRPLVLALDSDSAVRDSIKDYLTEEGYDVIAVGSVNEAREVLNMFTPSLVIAEIEGEGMPGFTICAHCKSTPRLQRIPVMMMTSSAYPSDYASAHSVGAVVCMAKPYKQERLGHVVRLLAPPPNANEETMPRRAGDPTRRHGRAPVKTPVPPSATRRFRFGSKS